MYFFFSLVNPDVLVVRCFIRPSRQVEACVDFECDYVDVNGEVPFTHKVSRFNMLRINVKLTKLKCEND